jgi:hypothetical protein
MRFEVLQSDGVFNVEGDSLQVKTNGKYENRLKVLACLVGP